MEEVRHRAILLLRDECAGFSRTIAALRALADAAEPHAESLDKESSWTQRVDERRALLPEHKRKEFSAVMAAATGFVLLVLRRGVVKGVGRPSSDTLTSSDLDMEEWPEVDPMSIVPEGPARDRFVSLLERYEADTGRKPGVRIYEKDGSYRVAVDDDEIRAAFWAVIGDIEAAALTPAHGEMLRRSILAMAVSAFEVLVGSIRRAHLMSHTRALRTRERVLTLEDLLNSPSIEHAVEAVIDSEVEEFSRKGLEDWAKWFRDKPLQVPLEELALNWAQTREVFQRRNAVIHHNGRVSRQYLNNVDTAITGDLEVGHILLVTRDYLTSALDEILTLGMLLAFRVRRCLFVADEQEAAGDWVLTEQFALLRNGRYGCVERIADVARNESLEQSLALPILVNGWLAAERLGKAETVQREVEAWDVSAMHAQFQLAKLVLLRRDDLALERLPALIDDGTFAREDLANWPLFARYRDEGRLVGLLDGPLEAPSGSDEADQSEP